MTWKFALVFFVVFMAARFLGAIGFPQIVGSLQQFKPYRLFTIILWGAIIAGGWYAVKRFVPDCIIALYFGYGWSLIDTLRAGKIE